MRNSLTFWIGAAVFLVVCTVLALTLKDEYAFRFGYTVLQFILLATAWNILGGYAGYVNFGSNAFFGIGAYTSVFLFKAFDLPLLLQILAAACVGALLGIGTGIMTLRLRGIFYSIGTVAIGIIIETLVLNWRYVGGASGIQLQSPPPLPPFDSYIKMMFVVAAILVVIGVATARYVETSWIGRGLKAIRDDEVAAECSGVPTLKLKLIACGLSGALMCVAGAPSPMFQQYAIPSAVFDLNYSVYALAMSLIGGTAHWIGPVIGAVVLSSTQQIVGVTISSELNVLVLGVMLVMFVIVAPDGIIGWFRRKPRTAAEPAATAEPVAPGARS